MEISSELHQLRSIVETTVTREQRIELRTELYMRQLMQMVRINIESDFWPPSLRWKNLHSSQNRARRCEALIQNSVEVSVRGEV